MRYGFIRQQMKAYPVTVLCKVMEVSRSGFYDYLHRSNKKTDHSPYEAALKTRIQVIFKQHRGKYGSRRITKQLKDEDHQIGRYKVRRLMRELGLKAKVPRRYKVTTDSRHGFSVAPNILNRNFEVKKPNKVWAADITYVSPNQFVSFYLKNFTLWASLSRPLFTLSEARGRKPQLRP